MWMLAHCTFILGFCIARVAFEEKPWIYVVYTEWYLDGVFFIDMLRILNSPITDKKGKLIYRRKEIIKSYVLGWLLWDLFAFYPLAHLRYISKRSEGGRDDMENFLNRNYERLPRFYKIMLVLQLARTRFTLENLRLMFKRCAMAQYQAPLKCITRFQQNCCQHQLNSITHSIYVIFQKYSKEC